MRWTSLSEVHHQILKSPDPATACQTCRAPLAGRGSGSQIHLVLHREAQLRQDALADDRCIRCLVARMLPDWSML
jgi:hypothetical protein